jgi:hypothetical protein
MAGVGAYVANIIIRRCRGLNIVDLVIIVSLVVGAINGYRRGLFGSLCGLAANLLGLFVAIKYYPQLSSWLNQQFSLSLKVSQFFKAHVMLPPAVSTLQLAKLPLPDLIKQLESTALPPEIKLHLMDYLQKWWRSLSSFNNLGELIHYLVAIALINGLAFFLIWLVVDKTAVLLAEGLTRCTQNSLVGDLNRLSGTMIGVGLRALSLTIFLGIISPLLSLTSAAQPSLFSSVLKTMNQSQLVPYFTSAFTLLFSKLITLWQ